MTTYTDLVREGELRVRVDSDGIAEWYSGDGRYLLGYGPGTLWTVRVVSTGDLREPFRLVGVTEVLVEADTVDRALEDALQLQAGRPATAELVDGPVEVPDIDEAIIAGLTRELGSSHFVQEV